MYPRGKPNGGSPSDVQAQEKLDIYVYDYLFHRGARNAAKTFFQEINWRKPEPTLQDPGFLLSWWSVFWDLYCAAPERREQRDNFFSQEAKCFYEYGFISAYPQQPNFPHHPGGPAPAMMGGPEVGPHGGGGPQQFIHAFAGPGGMAPGQLPPPLHNSIDNRPGLSGPQPGPSPAPMGPGGPLPGQGPSGNQLPPGMMPPGPHQRINAGTPPSAGVPSQRGQPQPPPNYPNAGQVNCSPLPPGLTAGHPGMSPLTSGAPVGQMQNRAWPGPQNPMQGPNVGNYTSASPSQFTGGVGSGTPGSVPAQTGPGTPGSVGPGGAPSGPPGSMMNNPGMEMGNGDMYRQMQMHVQAQAQAQQQGAPTPGQATGGAPGQNQGPPGMTFMPPSGAPDAFVNQMMNSEMTHLLSNDLDPNGMANWGQ